MSRLPREGAKLTHAEVEEHIRRFIAKGGHIDVLPDMSAEAEKALHLAVVTSRRATKRRVQGFEMP